MGRRDCPMPVNYRFDSNIVVIEMVGEYSMDDIRTTILNSLNDSKCPANPFILANLSESRSIYIRSSEDVKTMARSLASLANRFNNRIALVAPNDLIYGLMRMGSVFSEEKGMKVEIFRVFTEARKWLQS
ncbi:MAG: hypothetical protein WAO19_00270 [Candidatus Kryptoniota bacterium]